MRMSRMLVLTTLTMMVACLMSNSPLVGRTALGAEAPKKDPQAERGKYLAHHVALCVYCHSPRTPDGQVIEGRAFQGAPIPVVPVAGGPEWATAAPNLKSIAEIWGEADLIKFLQTGAPPRGAPPRLPMPPFRMNEEDATAVAKYLRSLR